MKAEELESGMEELLLRLKPELVSQWKGATEEQIDKIEIIVRKISGHDLPKFYRWFLMRMGQSMGQHSIPDMDYSAATVLSWYDEDFVDDGTKFFKVGHSLEGGMDLHMYYDFNYPAREDARLTRRAPEGGDDYPANETFREMLASYVVNCSAMRCSNFCRGTMRNNTGGDLLPALDPVMAGLGFKKPAIPTGLRCGLYEGSQAFMKVSTAPNLVTRVCGFSLGCNDVIVLRNILNTIQTEYDFDLKVNNDPRKLRDS